LVFHKSATRGPVHGLNSALVLGAVKQSEEPRTSDQTQRPMVTRGGVATPLIVADRAPGASCTRKHSRRREKGLLSERMQTGFGASPSGQRHLSWAAPTTRRRCRAATGEASERITIDDCLFGIRMPVYSGGLISPHSDRPSAPNGCRGPPGRACDADSAETPKHRYSVVGRI
jgi:hypothetical protein